MRFSKMFMGMFLLMGLLEKGHSLEPEKVAACETNVWRAYYAKDLGKVQEQMKLFLEQTYAMSDATKALPLYLKAVVTFGKTSQDTSKEKYTENILPLLKEALEEIKKTSVYSDFNVDSLAEKELAWWVARRFSSECNIDNVGAIMAEAYALFYGGSSEKYEKAALLRSYAARYRDNCQDQFGGVSEDDWLRIQEMLIWSYKDLKDIIKIKD